MNSIRIDGITGSIGKDPDIMKDRIDIIKWSIRHDDGTEFRARFKTRADDTNDRIDDICDVKDAIEVYDDEWKSIIGDRYAYIEIRDFVYHA